MLDHKTKHVELEFILELQLSKPPINQLSVLFKLISYPPAFGKQNNISYQQILRLKQLAFLRCRLVVHASR